MIVEFLVPREQFLLAPEKWETSSFAGDSTLGADYAVVMRWRERARGLIAAEPANWLDRAAKIRQRLDAGAPSALLWVDKQQFSAAALINRIATDSDAGECVALGFVPPHVPLRGQADLLGAALVGGAPFVCIFNREPEDRSIVKDELDSFVRFGVDDMPQRLLEKRLGASHLGTSATVVWDLPDHLPGPLAAIPPGGA